MTFARRLPKAELHLHIEGTLEPDLMFELAARNGVDLGFQSAEEVRAAYEFNNLQEFLDIYYRGANVLLQPQDFSDLAYAYFQRANADGVRRAEIFFDPQTHTERGVPMGAIVDGLTAGMEKAGMDFGISSDLILCFLRHLPPEAAMATLVDAMPFRDKFIAVGLDSSEVGYPPSLFTDVYDRARAEGLHAVAHAGEEGPPEYIYEALDLLGVERVDHGVRCLEDPALVERLVANDIPLTVCPLSNIKLGVFGRIEDHSLPQMIELGLSVTINSDDPAYFGGYIGDNYQATADIGVSEDQLVKIAQTSFGASFISDAEKAVYKAEIIEFVARQPGG